MTLPLTTRRLLLGAAALLIGALYLSQLSGTGLVSKDEPRYADIGRAMARSGDPVTPRLRNEPWFEKPPLLYWLIAAGFLAGLGPELAPRLPVALLSLGFLIFYWLRVRKLFDVRTAAFATGMLATSAGWVALSGIAVTDVPMAVFFSAAVLIAMDESTRRNLTLCAASLGLAVLAKSLVPLVLFAPVLLLDYRRLTQWLRPAPVAVFLAVALPWHIVCYLRNGHEFLSILFVQQQFGRFATTERQHGQPWWFYLPVLLLVLYPWFPLLAAAARNARDRSLRIPAAVLVFGFVFFSASLNKLPTYLTPLLPSACILMGAALAKSPRPERWMVLPAALLGLAPAAVRALPDALARGIHTAIISPTQIAAGFTLMALIGAAIALLARDKAPAIAFALTAAALIALKTASFPALDRAASARPVWLAEHPTCIAGADRSMVYGLQYYASRSLPPCVNPGPSKLDPHPVRVVR